MDTIQERAKSLGIAIEIDHYIEDDRKHVFQGQMDQTELTQMSEFP